MGTMHLIVDNTAGGDTPLAASVADGLRAHGYDVELREPEPASMFDTAVHLVSTGIVLRADERPPRKEIGEISEVVRAALTSHPSVRRRSRAVPLTVGTSSQVLTWIDAFD
ncbi:MAG: hypothetical protein QOI71_3459 [Gaiellales bacterium]|nr:hypothetical protein [Gaiellales bacterium]